MKPNFDDVLAAHLKKKEETATKILARPGGSALTGKQIAVQPYECGFCNAGFHYQTKRSRGPVCRFVYNLGRYGVITCMCDCTKTERAFREMAKAMGKELPTDSESEFVLPAPSARTPVTVDASDPADTVSADTPPPVAQDHMVGLFKFGETGRVEKGQLEEAVWKVCKDALYGPLAASVSQVTPQFIAFEIALRTGTEYKPSPGAVSAVLERWAKIMWCEIEKGPMRITSMRDDLMTNGPSKMKSDISDALRRTLRRF